MPNKPDFIKVFLTKKAYKPVKTPWRKSYDPEAEARNKKQKQELYQDY